MSEVKTTQFFGRSPRYPDCCVELRFSATSTLVPVSSLQPGLRQLIPGWRAALPDAAPVEEAIALIAQPLLERRMPAWVRYGRDGTEAWIALGSLNASLAHFILTSLHRLLTCAPPERQRAWMQFKKFVHFLGEQQAVNFGIMAAARSQDIEPTWINPPVQIFQLGQGSRGLHFCEIGNGRDSFTGMMLETSKANTVDALNKLGLPTTRGRPTITLEGAINAAKAVGFPCVVKPLNRSKGKGITASITNMEELAEAFALATSDGRPMVLVENHVHGIDHRIMVVNDRVLWAYSKVPASVTGDGTSTVRALIARENASRSVAKDSGMTVLEPIKVNAELESFLKRRYSLGLDHVVGEGQTVELASQANISLGGILEDVTARLHPDNRRLAVRVARYFRMNALGIDFVTPDISRSWKEVPCAIIEVNRTPGVSGDGDTSLAVRTIFPRKGCGQIPVLVTIGGGEFRKKVGAQLTAAAQGSGARVATVEYTARDGFPNVLTAERPSDINLVLLDPEVDAIVLACDPDWIAERGFPLGRADLALAEDPSALSYLDGVIAEISVLPPTAEEVEQKVAEIFAHHARDGEIIPVLTLTTADEGLLLRCVRFAATPRDWFYHELGLTDSGTHHMIDYVDVSSAVTQLANRELAKDGIPDLRVEVSFVQPAAPWTTPFVESTLSVRADATVAAANAVGKALDAINEVLSRKLD